MTIEQQPHPDHIQHGGDHYKQGGQFQHWNVMYMLGYGWEYYAAACSKYVSRYGKKNGAEDVSKAVHFTDKLIAEVEAGNLPPVFQTTRGLRMNIDSPEGPYNKLVNVEQLAKQFCEANAVTDPTAQGAIYRIFAVRDLTDLRDVRRLTDRLHKQLTGYVEPAPHVPTPAETLAKAQADAQQGMALGLPTDDESA